MSKFSVMQPNRGSSEFSRYIFVVIRDGEPVAEIAHTARGDEFFLRKAQGQWKPTKRLIIESEDKTLSLSVAGIAAVEKLLAF